MEAHLCADKQSDRKTDAEARAQVVFGPEVMAHVLDDAPVGFSLFFVALGLLGEEGVVLRGLGRGLFLDRFGFDALFCGLLGLLLALQCPGCGLVFTVAWSRDEDAFAGPCCWS